MTLSEYNTFLSIKPILHLLAKRIKPEYKYRSNNQWYSFVSNYGHSYYVCLICDCSISPNILVGTASARAARLKHGLDHLKEYNLLAFL